MHQCFPHFNLADLSQNRGPGDVAATTSTAAAVPQKSVRKLFKSSPRINSLLGVQVTGIGAYVPENVVTNADLETRYGFEPGWIEQRTGILERRHAPIEQATSDLCVEAGRRALKSARLDSSEIDLVVVGTFTPDHACPSTACLVQHQLGIDAPAFDLQAACSGFVYALVTAAQFVATGNARAALVIGGDINSRIVNPHDQRTAPLFGDGAGAVILTRGEPHQGLLCYQLGADGGGGPLLEMPCGGTRRPAAPDPIALGEHFLKMDGRNVFKWAVQALTETVDQMLAKAGMSPHDVSLYAFHQANIRIINYAVEQLGIPQERVVNNLQRFGNTSAASIPIALEDAYRAGRVNRGSTILMSGFGGGLTWGTGLFRW